MYIWWIFLFLASKTVADQSGSDLANNGGESKLWLTDRADRIENVLLNLSNHIEITKLHDEIRNLQDKISVVENKIEEMIANCKQEMDAKLREINVQTDNLYTNLTDMVKQEINATSSNINVQTDDLDTNLTDMVKQEINATSSNINVQTDDLDTDLTDMVKQEINATSSNINMRINNLDTNLTNTMKQNTNIAQHNILPDDATIAKLTSVNDHVKIQVADPEAFHASVVQQRQQAIQNRSYRSSIESWQPNSLQQLAENIKAFSKGKSLIDRHWIIFYWIAYNIKYDTVSYFSKDYKDQSAEAVFRTKQGVCAGYANIYKHLCDQLQMPCEVVAGFAKGYGFDNRESASTEINHAWNAVEIDRHWYLIESTWSAGYLNKEKIFEPKLNHYYFLPRPNEMIYHHLPEDEKWQLLRTPINMTQYMQMPRVHPPYFELNVELVSPRDQAHVDLFPGSPYALVIMQTPSDVHLIADLKLNHQKIDGGDYVIFDNKKQLYYCYFAPSKIGKHKITIYGKQEQGDTDSGSYSRVLELTLNVKQMPSNPISFPKTWKNFFDLGLEVILPQNTHLIRLNNGTTHTQIQIKTPDNVQLMGSLESEQGEKVIGGNQVYYDREKNIWRCNFAPNQSGFFDAMIFAKKKSDSGNYAPAVSFKIEAKQMLSNPISFPNTWENFFDLGLEVISPQNTHLIRLNNGTTHTQIQIKTPDNVQLMGSLKSEQGEKIIGGNQVYYDREKNIWRCNFAPDQTGFFNAMIFAKKKSDPGNYALAVSFKIEAKQMVSNPISFPNTWENFFDLGLEVISPQNTHLIRLNNGTTHTQIQIKTPDNVQLMGSLESEQGEKVIGGNQVYYDREKNIWRCNFAPNQSGFFDAMIFAKKKSDPGNDALAVSFKIEAKKIPSPPLSYPYARQLFYDLGLKIEAPKNRSNAIWPDKASYAEVLIQAPDDVTLSSSIVYNNLNIENGSLAQYNHEKQYWQLLFAPERNGPHELIVYAKRTDGNESSVVKFNLNVTKLQRPMKFPLIYSHFETKKCRIYTPIDGILKKGSIVPIHYVIPGAIDVDLVVDSKWLNIEGYKDSILQRQITVGSKEVIIYAKYEEKSNYNPLFKYTVQ